MSVNGAWQLGDIDRLQKSALRHGDDRNDLLGPMSNTRRVCILLFDGVDDTNVTGCAQVFATCNSLSGNDLFELSFASVDGVAVSAQSGAQITPTHRIWAIENFDVIVLPAGSGIVAASRDLTLCDWLRRQAGREFFVISLCRGAKLAEALVPDDRMEFTTHPDAVEAMTWAVSNGVLVSNVIYRDNGKVIAGCGLVGPFEAALHLVARLHSQDFAEAVAQRMEYDWTGPHDDKVLIC